MPNTIEYVGKVDLKHILEKLKDEIDKGGGGTSDYEQLTNLPSINDVEIKGNKTLQEYGGANYFKGTTAEVLEHYGITSIDDIPEGNITTITDIEPESSDVTADEIDYIAPYKDEEEVSNVKEGLDYLFKGEFWDVDNRIHKVTKEYMYYKNDEYSDPFYKKSSIYIRSRSNNVLCKQTNTRFPGQVGTQIAPSYKRDNGYMDKSGHYYIGEFTIYRFDLPESNKYYTFYTLAGTDDLIIYLDMPLTMEIDNKQNASTAITTDNISQQSVAHATTADSADADGAGNNIVDTYATKNELSSKQDANTAITTSNIGNQTVFRAVRLGGAESQNELVARSYAGTPIEGYSSTFFQQDLTNNCVNIGINGAGAVGVNRAKNAARADYATSAGNADTVDGLHRSSFGNSLAVNGTSVSLKNSDGTVLNTITTQDTTYSSQSASSGSSTVSLCTRGEKYTWNNKADKAGSTSQNFSCNSLYTKGHILTEDKVNWMVFRSDKGCACRNYANSAYSPITASGFQQQSSRRYKENIENMTDEFAKKLLELRPVKYDYINKEDGVNKYGLIAEEVAEIETHPVSYRNGIAEGLDYSSFVPQLIKMIQIQQKEIDELKSAIEELKTK